jgi:hypothetical protein
LSEGAYVWLIPDGYIPEGSTGRQPSHEAICVLNPSGEEAHLSITFYFEDRDPIKDVRVTVPPERTRHIRTDLPEHLGGTTVPKGVPYAVRVACDVPVTVQHSRMDTSQEALALMTTMAHPVG